ncbi:MAG: hypothetical protein ACFFC6_00955 [Promethearchaeota archaeon]
MNKFAINPYFGEVYLIEQGVDYTIEVIYDYLTSYSHSPGSVLSYSYFLSHTTAIKDVATVPIYPYAMLFSTDSHSLYVAYYDYYGNFRVDFFLDVPLSSIGGSWDGEFTVDNFGYLYFAGKGGKIYRYDIFENEFSLYYSSAAAQITSLCFDNKNILYYTSGDNRVYRVASLAQKEIDFTIIDPLDIAIVFVGYDQDLINTTTISSKLPHYGSVFLGGEESAHTTYQATYSYHFANQSYQDALDTFVADHSVINPTVQLDIPNLEYQAEFWTPQDVFIPKNGTAIDGNAVESWLAQNRYVNEADYCISVLNFSYFDTEALDHWFEIKNIDVDSGLERHWFRNEFDFPWNLDARFPYVGYTGYESSDIFFDPTAFQWYLKWIEVWNGLNINDGDHDFYDEDLDHFMQTLDPESPSGRIAINDYISDWIAELVPVNLFWEPVNRIDFAEDLSLQIKIFNGVSDLGFTNTDLEWVVNETAIKYALTELMPGTTIHIDIEFLYLENYSSVQSVLTNRNNIVNYSPDDPPIENYTYYNGMAIYDTLHNPTYRQTFFDLTAADLIVTGYALILDNATFASPGIWSGGGLFTGLGGDQRILQLMELDRLYYPNRTETVAIPRQGLSTVLVHELGHAIGYPHTFTSTEYVSDFTADTMGYYGDYTRYSKIRIESFQRYAVEQEIFELLKMLQELMLNNAELEWVENFQNNTWENVTNKYKNKDYLGARQVVMESQQLLSEYLVEREAEISTETSRALDSVIMMMDLLFSLILLSVGVFAVVGVGACVYFIIKHPIQT